MMSRILYLAIILVGLIGDPAFARFHSAATWQSQFANAAKWSTLGVIADGTTDNTTALNALPTSTPIIGDCPAGSNIVVSGTWFWQSGLTIWQQQGCLIKSGVTTVGQYAIDDPNFSNGIPNTNIQYYGLNISMATPTSTVRVMRLWADHFKLKYFNVNGSGGFAFIRGSDQEIAYGRVENTLTAVGNPGIRHIGNIPSVPTSGGMPANVWIHDNNIQSGDAVYQACQPLGTAIWTNVSSDGILFENNVGSSASSAMILANQPNPNGNSALSNYSCNNITYRNTTGTGNWVAIISAGGDLGTTSNITIDSGTMTAISASFAPMLIGDITVGGSTSTGAASNVLIENTTLFSPFSQPYTVTGTVPGFSFVNNIFNPRTTNTGSFRTTNAGATRTISQ